MRESAILYGLWNYTIKLDLIVDYVQASLHLFYYYLFADPPEITHKTSDKTACIGDEVTLFCAIDGIPPPTIQWYHGDSKVVSQHARYVFIVERDEQYGNYTCKATNIVGKDTFEMRLIKTSK